MSTDLYPKQLYDRCETQERELEKFDINRDRDYIAKEILFGPLFTSDAEPGLESSQMDKRQIRIHQAIERGNRYRDLLELLRKVNDREGRWLLLARWLRQEEVCKPEDFLPKEFLRALTRRLYGKIRGKTRWTDLTRVRKVEIWLPYFDKLMEERHALKAKNVKYRINEELEKAGYDPGAIAAAEGVRSPLEALYSWFSEERKIGAVELYRNAYTRLSGALGQLTPEEVAVVFRCELDELASKGEISGLLKRAQSPRKRSAKIPHQNSPTKAQ